MFNRGGQILKSGKIGRVNCIKQMMLRPGETVKPYIRGDVKMATLRERDSIRANAQIHVFMTPLRWLWEDWPQFVKDGPTSALVPPTFSSGRPVDLGIGGNPNLPIYTWYRDAYLRVYNEWFKWLESADATAVEVDGNKAVPLSSPSSRSRVTGDPDDITEARVASATVLDVRELAQRQAEFKAAIDRDVISAERYGPVLQGMFGADGSKEVDQVPMKIDSTETGIDPREMAATDGPSLGQWHSIYDFGVSHDVGSITAPEHCILSFFIVVRFATIYEDDTDPLAVSASGHTWAELVGHDDMLANTPPVDVVNRQLFGTSSTASLGTLPAGWEWRTGVNLVGTRVDVRDAFPLLLDSPSNFDAAKDATRTANAFTSTALGDYMADLYINCPSYAPTAEAIQSWKLGANSGKKGREFITPGVE